MQKQTSIAIPQIELIDVNELIVDEKNPNVMTKDKFEALKENIKKYGFIVPIITNKDLVIADGEHRLRAAKELKMPKVGIYRLPMKEVDRRFLRQFLNKVRGEHDFFKDKEEFQFLLQEIDIDSLSASLAMPKSIIESYIVAKEFEELPDVDLEGEIVHGKEVLIIQFETQAHMNVIKKHLDVPLNRKSVNSGSIIHKFQ